MADPLSPKPSDGVSLRGVKWVGRVLRGGFRLLVRVSNWLVERSWIATHKYWWVPLAVALIFLASGYTALTALAKHLKTMHATGGTGYSLEHYLGSAHLDKAVAQWRQFWEPANQPLA